MRKNIIQYIKSLRTTVALGSIFLSIPILLFAQGGGGSPSGGSSFSNPLKFDTLQDFLVALLDTIILIAVPIIVLAVIYAGFLFVTAQGNEIKLKTAKTVIIFTLVGAAIILGAKVLAEAIKGTVDSLGTAPGASISLQTFPWQS